MSAIPTELEQSIRSAGSHAFGSGWQPESWYRAPGRIELIGNHVDYNGGPVLAAAIDRGIVSAVARSGASRVIRGVFPDLQPGQVHQFNLPLRADWRSERLRPEPDDYLRGVLTALAIREIAFRSGIALVVQGNLPHGIGLSSSAALCVNLVLALADQRMELIDVVLAAQEGEHRAGSPCGTMDQSASANGGLIRYDGATGESVELAADLGKHKLLVVNSGVVRSLATSAYPERVRETSRALAILRRDWNPALGSLAQVSTGDLERAQSLLTRAGEPVLALRVRHAVTECARVRQAISAVGQDDWPTVGELMIQSGLSSATDYNISHPQVEVLVAECRRVNGVLGARMMGGGQGGSVLVLAKSDAIEALMAHLDLAFFAKLDGSPPAVRYLPCTFASGAGPVAVD